MTNSIMNILINYGFENRHNVLWWGTGSLMWGYIATVRNMGNDRYEVKYQVWDYDCDGECVRDESTTVVLYGALMLQYLFERLPLFRRRR